MVSRLPGAIIRAILVMALAVLPSVVVPGVSVDSKQMAALVALFVGLMIFFEYNGDAPSLIEFRDAPPFNSCRFGLLFAVVALLSLVERNHVAPGSLGGLVAAVGALFGHMLDFDGSPVRMAAVFVEGGMDSVAWPALRAMAGLAYVVGFFGTGLVVLLLVRAGWPWRGQAFNVWVNLPTFDPTTGKDVVARLQRDAGINLLLGFFLPFLIPAVVRFALGGIGAEALLSPQTLIWTMAAWVFIPASLVLRGVAMLRVAQMVRQKRRASALAYDEGFFAA